MLAATRLAWRRSRGRLKLNTCTACWWPRSSGLLTTQAHMAKKTGPKKTPVVPLGLAPDPTLILAAAEAYTLAAVLTRNGASPDPAAPLRPALPECLSIGPVLDAFAFELFLKCLYVVHKKTRPPLSHSLVAIYDMLAAGLRQQIAEGWAKEPLDKTQLVELVNVVKQDGKDPRVALARLVGVRQPQNFRSELTKVSDDFVKWRYEFEPGTTIETANVKDALPTVARLIREHMPGAGPTLFERTDPKLWKSLMLTM